MASLLRFNTNPSLQRIQTRSEKPPSFLSLKPISCLGSQTPQPFSSEPINIQTRLIKGTKKPPEIGGSGGGGGSDLDVQVGRTQMLGLCGFGYWIQGFRCFPWLALNFHMAHNLNCNPSVLQLVQNSGNLPFVAKPLYGVLSDALYIGGAHRIPYVSIGGASELCHFLDSKKIRRGLITRNVKDAVDVFHKHFGSTFSPALSREFHPYKPNPAPLLHICSVWKIEPQEVMMIGDSLKDDVVCGKRAGAYTILLDETGRYDSPEYSSVEHKPDFKVSSLKQALSLLETNFYLAP